MKIKNTLGNEFWDNVAKNTSKHYRNKYISEFHKYENENLLSGWCRSLRNKRVLVTDLFNEAFDRDELPSIFRDPYVNVIGVDISKIVVEKFHERYPSHRKLVCDIRRPPFKDGQFDFVISFSTLDHFSQFDLEISLREIRRILKKRGVLILYLNNKQNIFLYFYQMKVRKMLNFPIEIYSRNQTISILKRSGFSISECTAIIHLFFPIFFHKILTHLERTQRKRLHRFLVKMMYKFDKLGKTKIKYLTGKFIAVKAVK